MLQEIYCKAELKMIDIGNIGEVGIALEKAFPISNVLLVESDTLVVEITTEYNAAYRKAKIKKWIDGDLLHLSVSTIIEVEILELLEEAEIYGLI